MPADSAVAADDPYERFIAQTDPLTPAQQLKKFHVPPGFKMELVAAEPDIRKPINLRFDADGRLLVTGSVEYPHGATKGTTPRDTIKILADTNRDGVFDQVSTFAEGLNIPIGLTPLRGGVLAYDIPNICRFADRDADGRADGREVIFGGFGFADTHGMPSSFTWWIDGWIYACHGEGNTSTVAGSDGQQVTMHGGSTFRVKSDGTHIERFTHGQANPFGFCFDPLGNAYSADSHSRPAYLLLRNAWYPGLDRRHDGLGFGPEMMQHHHNSTGIAGIAYYAADHFPAQYHDTLFIGNPATGRINHNRLEVHGSTYRAIEQPDFLTCDDPWFRPVDVQLGPDGALYIADFYDRIIGHNVVPLGHAKRDRLRGRLWRVTHIGANQTERPRRVPNLTTATLHELLGCLAVSNLEVRTQATHELVERIGGNAVDPVRRLLQSDSHPWQRVHGLWILHRLDALDENLMIRLTSDSDRAVRVHLMKVLAEIANWGAEMSAGHRLALGGLSDADAFVRRAAADALGRHPFESNIRPLLDRWSDTPLEDTLLIHTVRMAVRDNLHALPNIVDVAQRLGDQPLIQQRLADVCLGIKTANSAEFLFSHIRSASVDSTRLGELLCHAASYLDCESLPELYAFVQTFQDKTASEQMTVLKAVRRAADQRGVILPPEISTWGLTLARTLLASDEELSVYSGIELVWDLKLTELSVDLAELAAQASSQRAIRSIAMDALAAVDKMRACEVLEEMLNDLMEPIDLRQKAALTLGKLNTDRSRSVLIRHLPAAPARIATSIARELAISQPGAELLLANVSQGTASAHLLQDMVVDQRLRDSKPQDLEDRLTQLLADLPPDDIRLQRLVDQRLYEYRQAQPDLQRGAEVFEKHCLACHQLGSKGNQVGPRLDGAGLRGLERLVEDLLVPNQNVAEAFRSSVIELADGQIIAGLVLNGESDPLVLVDAEGKEHRIPLGEIEKRRFSKTSPMPANAAESISPSAFNDLIAFLLEQRASTEANQ